MESKVDFLKFQRKLNTLLAMPLYLYSTERLGVKFWQTLMVFYQFFTEVTVVIATICQMVAIPYVLDDMNVLCGCLSSTGHSIQVIAKTTFYRFTKVSCLKHVDAVHSFHQQTEQFEQRFLHRSSSFIAFHQKQTKYINVIACIQLLVNFGSTSAYFLPFIYDGIVNRHELHRQYTPIVVYLGMDINYTPIFQIVVIVLAIAFYIVNLKTVVLDNFILNLIIIHMSQLKYNNDILVEIVENGGFDQEVIKGWIRLHQALTSLCARFQRLISPYLFVEFTYILIHTCVPAFVITSTFSWTLAQKVAVFFMVGSGVVELFLMSNAGDDFSEAWKEIGNALFRAEYFSKNEKWMRHLYMIVQLKLAKPFRLSAVKIVPLSCATFALIMRLIFSYYMTLNQLQKVKHKEGGFLPDVSF